MKSVRRRVPLASSPFLDHTHMASAAVPDTLEDSQKSLLLVRTVPQRRSSWVLLQCIQKHPPSSPSPFPLPQPLSEEPLHVLGVRHWRRRRMEESAELVGVGAETSCGARTSAPRRLFAL